MTEVATPTQETPRQRRQREAKSRQAAHDKLTLDQKIAKARSTNPNGREHCRLLKKKAEEGNGRTA